MPTKETTGFDGIGRTHPIVAIVQAKKNVYTNGVLLDFVQYLQCMGNGQVPYTLVEFYGKYVKFTLKHFVQENPEYYSEENLHWREIRDYVDRMSRVAYDSFIKRARITPNMVDKRLHGSNLRKQFPSKEDVVLRSMGALMVDETETRRELFLFREQVVEEYLVANYLACRCFRRLLKSKSGGSGKKPSKSVIKSIVNEIFLDTMTKLPSSGDVLRMSFGLLKVKAETKYVQYDIFAELIEVAKRRRGMTSFDVTSLCVECIYESQNAGELTELLDEFTMNETINYSNVLTHRSRIPYNIQAAGYLVRASSRVYGLHLANFCLNKERISMLADPLNEVSDNSLQVLNLSCNSLGHKGICQLQRFIVKASYLTHFDLSLCELDRRAVSILSEFFMCMPLRYLNLSDNEIGDEGLIYMNTNLKYVPTLEILFLANNQLTDKSVVDLGRYITNGALPNIRSLDLTGNEIGTEAVTVLSKAIPGLHYLEEVKVASNTCTSREASRLMKRSWKTQSLSHVNVVINDIPSEGILTLSKLKVQDMREQIPMADEDLDNAVESSLALPSHSEEEPDVRTPSTSRHRQLTKSSSRLSDSQNVSLRVESVEKQRSSLDLLEGRPDKDRAVPLCSKGSSSMPRGMKDMRRSWHGMSSNLRESMRSTRESILNRTSSFSLRSSRPSSQSLRSSVQSPASSTYMSNTDNSATEISPSESKEPSSSVSGNLRGSVRSTGGQSPLDILKKRFQRRRLQDVFPNATLPPKNTTPEKDVSQKVSRPLSQGSQPSFSALETSV